MSTSSSQKFNRARHRIPLDRVQQAISAASAARPARRPRRCRSPDTWPYRSRTRTPAVRAPPQAAGGSPANRASPGGRPAPGCRWKALVCQLIHTGNIAQSDRPRRPAQPGASPMPVVVVANPKGGVGKIHHRYAALRATLPARATPSCSAMPSPAILAPLAWPPPGRRAPSAPGKSRSPTSSSRPREPPMSCSTPRPACTAKCSRTSLQLADKVVVPLQPSVFDIFATRAFLDELAEHRKATRMQVGIVGMRVDPRTHRRRQAARIRRPLACLCWATCAIRRTISTWPRAA